MSTIRTILAIESSADETAASVIRDGQHVLSNAVSSQIPIHRRFGGVVPEVAARAHTEQMIPVIEQALVDAFGEGDIRAFIRDKIDAIAVTNGPGLVGSLLTGVSAAKSLALAFHKPLIPTHHILGHVYSNFLRDAKETLVPYPFPFLALIVSGGHTQLMVMKSHNEYDIVGQTRDDAAGEAFDKAAHVLGLPYPGGPSISRAAEQGNPHAYSLPRGMAKQNNLDFSFSGLKTALAQLVHELKKTDPDISTRVPDLAASFQEAVIDSLVSKTIHAAETYQARYLYVGGGVAANKRLRQKLAEASEKASLPFSVPDFAYCTDNAAMVGAAAYAYTRAQGSELDSQSFPWYDVSIVRKPHVKA